MRNHSFSLILIVLISLTACNEEFNTLDSDIINEDTATNFESTSEKFRVLSYTDALGPVQTNGLGSQMLGIYNDPNYGRTSTGIVTQVSSPLFSPSFGNDVILDSVVLTIPLSSINRGVNEDNMVEYELTSVLPASENGNYSPIKLSIFENNYFLRNFDPTAEFDTPQLYFSNKSASTSELINESDLEYRLLHVENALEISNKEIILTDGDPDGEGAEIVQRLAPSIRLAFKGINDPVVNYFKEKIFDLPEGNPELSNTNNFNNYFRGIYFKAEPTDMGASGSLILLNLQQQNANFTVYYSNVPDLEAPEERNQATYTLGFGPNTVTFFENDFTINNGNATEGDARLNIKAGQGATAAIDLLFDSVDENSNINNFEAFKNEFANYDEDGNFESFKRLINEANLVFYVDESITRGSEEPNRLYIYDKTNSVPLADYFEDVVNNTIPLISLPNHLGILEREDPEESDSGGVKYTMKITRHILNLLENNTDNVQLGLSVSGNVNLEGNNPQFTVQTNDGSEKRVPVSALTTPRGTVLHGSNSDVEAKRLYLEIFYTCVQSCSED